MFWRNNHFLEGKDYKQKANIKSVEIAKIKSVPRQRVNFSGADFEIEISQMKAIDGGVEFLGRAWTPAGKQIGFGKDGSVEIERFRIYNPPVLVDDPNGLIIRGNVDINNKLVLRSLREDPIEAVKQSLTHTVKLVGWHGSEIIKGRVGNTTSTFYPAAGANEPVDGTPYRDVTAVPETWAAMRDGAGTHVLVLDVTFYIQMIKSALLYIQLTRNIVCIDATPIADTDTIDSVIASVWGFSKVDASSLLPTSDWYTSTPASTANLVAADYTQTGTVSQTGSPMTYAAFTVDAYNDYTFNATGRGNLSKTAISKFAWNNQNYDAANVEPPGSGVTYTLRGYSADQAGTANDVKFVVTHTAAASSFIPKITWW